MEPFVAGCGFPNVTGATPRAAELPVKPAGVDVFPGILRSRPFSGVGVSPAAKAAGPAAVYEAGIGGGGT